MRRLALCLAALAVLVGGCGDDERPPGPDPVRAAAERFLHGYLADDGRVVRRDQGGDTVSEGQAYAMLLAAAIGDERRFDLAWDWTRRSLQRPDGLLAWRWEGGRVMDGEPAADGDLDAARALLVAARRFDRPALADEGRRIARAVLRAETAGGRLVAGPWARDGGVANPSYTAPGTYGTLADADPRWRRVAAVGRADVTALTADGRLPPDWARVAEAGSSAAPAGSPAAPPVVATGLPSDPGAEPRYGFDAARLPVRLAETCAPPAARALAAGLWPTIRAGDPAVVPRTLDGRGVPGAIRHPVGLAGAAAAAHAVGDADERDRLLDAAAALDRERPTYYGAAWVALGRLWLQRPCRR